MSDNFYEKADERLARIQNLISKNDAAFVAKLAVYTREKMYLRSVPMVLAVELAKHHSGNTIVSSTVKNVVKRADEITELLAYYSLANKRKGIKKLNKLSKQIQKGLAESFNNFDEYQFAKYNRDTEVKLKDALFLVHPKAKNENQQLVFNKIASNTLTTPYTWETELSALGQHKFESIEEKTLAFQHKWEELIDSGKLGYMALLRNLRNILEIEVSDTHIEKVCSALTNPKGVENSKQLPFRFLAAYRELKLLKNNFHVGLVLDSIEEALILSVKNLKGFDIHTKVVIACDVSGSMQKTVSAKSKIMYYDIGLLLGMLMKHQCKNVINGMFGDKWKTLTLPSKNILQNVDEFYKREGEVGYSTNGYLVIEDLFKRKVVVDKVMMFTDCQMWDSNVVNQVLGNNIQQAWKKYKCIAPNAKLYLFDLVGNGTTPLNIQANDVHLIAGWSDKIFDVLNAIENGENALHEIENIELK